MQIHLYDRSGKHFLSSPSIFSSSSFASHCGPFFADVDNRLIGANDGKQRSTNYSAASSRGSRIRRKWYTLNPVVSPPALVAFIVRAFSAARASVPVAQIPRERIACNVISTDRRIADDAAHCSREGIVSSFFAEILVLSWFPSRTFERYKTRGVGGLWYSRSVKIEI